MARLALYSFTETDCAWKRCTKCGEVKPKSKFPMNYNKKRLYDFCIKCKSKHHLEYMHKRINDPDCPPSVKKHFKAHSSDVIKFRRKAELKIPL